MEEPNNLYNGIFHEIVMSLIISDTLDSFASAPAFDNNTIVNTSPPSNESGMHLYLVKRFLHSKQGGQICAKKIRD